MIGISFFIYALNGLKNYLSQTSKAHLKTCSNNRIDYYIVSIIEGLMED